jgi:hypothetical protein
MHSRWAERDLGCGEHVHDETVDRAGSTADRVARVRLTPLTDASDGGIRFRPALELSHDLRR